MKRIAGKCANCELDGTVGSACPERLCARKGYHFIPQDHFDAQLTIPLHSRDPYIGLMMGDYLIVGELGQGGFGKVYFSLQLPVFLPAALKVMARTTSDEALANTLARKFETEALNLARLNHPNIVRLLKYGTFEEIPYLVMEYVDGAKTLKQEISARINSDQGLELATSKRIVEQILNALQCAHDAGVIHRDIKPENIMLQAVAGDDYFVRVLDFGLSKFVEDQTHTSMVVGTPMYMAPEQITGVNIGMWTDLYSLGIITYEMLVGRRPFQGKTREEIFAQKLDAHYDPTSHLGGAVSAEVKRFLSRAVSHVIAKRFQTVMEFRQALEQMFGALGAKQNASIPASDLKQLLESQDLLKLTAVQHHIKVEQERLQHQQSLLKQERQTLERVRSGLTSGEQTVAASGVTAAMHSVSRPARSKRMIGYLVAGLMALVIGVVSILWATQRAKIGPEQAPSRHQALGNRELSPVAARDTHLKPKTQLTPKDIGGPPAIKIVAKTVSTPTKLRMKPTKVGQETNLRPVKIAAKPGPPIQPPVSPKAITLTVETKPKAAELWVGRERIGVTPHSWTTTLTGKTVRVVVKKRGYKTQLLKLVADQTRTVQVALRRKTRPRRDAKKGPGTLFTP